ncbi:MAG: hypothetical protein OZ919_00985 [Xanthomonadaceae bacterium]|nr:hypothetical protein [Xanthomonadaceae bacterium]
MITRRDLCVAALAAGATAGVLMTPWDSIRDAFSPAANGTGLGRPFDALLASLDGTQGVGRIVAEGGAPGTSADALIERLGARLEGALRDRTAIEARLGELVRADFAAARTCRVDGWMLSQTECDLAGLRWHLLGEAPAASAAAAPQAAAAAAATPGSPAAAIVEVTNWGPRTTEQGSKFNVQPDGHSGLWFVAPGTPDWVKVRIDGQESPTTVSEAGFTSGIFGSLQERILATPGSYRVELYDPVNDTVQPIGELVVRPMAERAIREDGTRSSIFCPVTEWGPTETTVGVAENAQPDGSQGMWFLLPCAPNNVQLVFGDDRLPATRTDRGITSRVPLALLESPGTVSISLRHIHSGEELTVGLFEIRP